MLGCAVTRAKFMDSLYSCVIAHLNLTDCVACTANGRTTIGYPLAFLQEETYTSKVAITFLTE